MSVPGRRRCRGGRRRSLRHAGPPSLASRNAARPHVRGIGHGEHDHSTKIAHHASSACSFGGDQRHTVSWRNGSTDRDDGIWMLGQVGAIRGPGRWAVIMGSQRMLAWSAGWPEGLTHLKFLLDHSCAVGEHPHDSFRRRVAIREPHARRPESVRVERRARHVGDPLGYRAGSIAFASRPAVASPRHRSRLAGGSTASPSADAPQGPPSIASRRSR